MQTKAVRLYGKNDLRLESFQLPAPGPDEILARVVSDSLCMSSYKAAVQGPDHKRVPDNVAEDPVIIGHKFCGEILEVGEKWAGQFQPGSKFAIQPALNYQGTLAAPGYSFPYIGGDATYVVIPNPVMEMGCLLPYEGADFFGGSLAEPLSCVIGTFHAMYHTVRGSYTHAMGIRAGGAMAILAGVGPMGLAAIDYILHCDRKPARLVVTDIDQARLDRAGQILSQAEAERNGIQLTYLNTGSVADPVSALLAQNGGKGYDDVLCFAPVAAVVEQADAILGGGRLPEFLRRPFQPRLQRPLQFLQRTLRLHPCGGYLRRQYVGHGGGPGNDEPRASYPGHPGDPHRRSQQRGGYHPEPAPGPRRQKADLYQHPIAPDRHLGFSGAAGPSIPCVGGYLRPA